MNNEEYSKEVKDTVNMFTKAINWDKVNNLSLKELKAINDMFDKKEDK